ncbi:phosphoserine phosphatase [Ruminobacter amylophilus]|jgi:phosphoserine phosphatase|uniref:Phosphoserine phosphatase n=1 Tax=Ruminobacter amylophilus TaxID=867 RepID=A0A662ZKY2_9GAMM|nr:phosphoserine phosphatase SerB [Ruminobacter amylophilus]SFP68935.1 phosphoserine phosphatase [Ruminobacter amylophilus]
MAEFNFNADEELFSRLPEKAFYTVVDNKVVSADGNISGGYICAIGDRITMQHLGMIKELADRSGVSFAFREPFAICGKQVLIAVTDRYSEELNRAFKAFTGDADVIHVKNIPDLSKPGVILLDMDSTCIQIECIDEIAKAYGVGKQISEITSMAMHGKLDFKQSLRKRVGLLKYAPVSILDKIRNSLPIMPGFPELIRLLQSKGWKTAIASGGFMPFVNKLKEDFGLDLVRANTFEIEGDHLTGGLIGEIVDSTVKVATLHELCAKYDIPKEQSIAVGDGANDLPMINESGLGFAIHAKPIVREKATATINTLGLDAIVCVLTAYSNLKSM